MDLISIDRSSPFDPTLYGDGWGIWKGHAKSNGLIGPEDQDERSLALREIDLDAIKLQTYLEAGEPFITSEERHRRLKEAGHIRLDAQVFLTLWRNQHRIPARFQELANNALCITFDGTVLRDPLGYRRVLYLHFFGRQCYWNRLWVSDDSLAAPYLLSAVLAA